MNIDSLSKLKFFIDDKFEKCYLKFDQNVNYKAFKLEDFLIKLKALGVVAGIKQDIIESIINDDEQKTDNILVAKKIDPVKGKNGSFKYLVDYDEVKVITEENKVNFYETGLIKNLDKGTKLIEIIPPTKGINGKNLKGDELVAKPGENANVNKVMGKGTELSKDNKYIIASFSGVYQKNLLGMVTISDKLVIKGNLDFSVGNIETTSAVTIKGDIKAGFSVKTSSSLVVEGVIEDALVEVGKNLICKQGILSGKNIVKVKDTLVAKYISEREVYGKHINVEGMINNSVIYATNTIVAQKIIGGNCVAGTLVEVKDLGNRENIKTLVKTGVNYSVQERIDSNNDELFDLTEKFQELKSDQVKLRVKQRSISEKTEQIKNMSLASLHQDNVKEILLEAKNINITLNNLINEQEIIKLKIVKLKKELSILHPKLENRDCQLVIKNTVYPNTFIKLTNQVSYAFSKRAVNKKLSINEEFKVIVADNS